MARKYYQGKFTPKNPEKYVGDPNEIYFRSSWELKFMVRLDTDPQFTRWNSEEIEIPYVSPVDGRLHRYFPDFLVEYRTKSGEMKKALVEIKPYIQTQPPKQPKRVTKNWMATVETYAVNTEKWKAARGWCEKQGVEFMLLTEKQLGI